jgi:prepilin-type N-terminal cleavage/methylation domain-containing protein
MMDRMASRGPGSRLGFTLLEIMIVVTLIGLLAAIAIPNFTKAREEGTRKMCISNLIQIHSAKVRWALDQRKALDAVPADTDLFGVDSYIRKRLTCPTGGAYDYRQVDEQSTCTFPGHVAP